MRHPALSRFSKIFGWLVLALLIACGPPFLVPSAVAQGHGHGGGHGGGDRHGGGGWHGGGWHGGGWYGGIGLGWWGWPYYLDWPYYPYTYYPPPVYQAPVVIPQAPVVIQQAPATSAQSSFWYYCANPKGYYPYVQSCQGAWQPVPAVPPGAVPGAQN